MGLIAFGVNSWYAYKTIRRLSQRWEDTPAFKAGIIDKSGKKIVKDLSFEQKREYTAFDRILYNLKRVISKVPGSQNPFIRYATALVLLKEDEATEEFLETILQDIEFDLDEETPVVNVGSGHIDLTPTKPAPVHKRKKLRGALEEKLVSNSSEIV